MLIFSIFVQRKYMGKNKCYIEFAVSIASTLTKVSLFEKTCMPSTREESWGDLLHYGMIQLWKVKMQSLHFCKKVKQHYVVYYKCQSCRLFILNCGILSEQTLIYAQILGVGVFLSSLHCVCKEIVCTCVYYMK